ncbi:MAG: hypothetical protein JKY17_01990 [Magnetovibrio sp.]|nr:hypothetical protein [Magnetovibrio sp.]
MKTHMHTLSGEIDNLPPAGHVRLLRSCEAIEAAVQEDDFDECALLLSELVALIRQLVHFDSSSEFDHVDVHGQRAMGRVYHLLGRCREPFQADDQRGRTQLRDDIRNGLILMLSDVVECERCHEGLCASPLGA